MDSQKPCRKVESETSDRKMESKNEKRRKKNIDSKKDKEEKNKDSHSRSKKEKNTGDKLFLKKVYSKLTKIYEMFRRALSKARRYTMSFCVVISNNTSSSGMDEMQEILVISQTELQDFTNLECLTTLRLRSVNIPSLSGESPEESYEDTESVVHGSENCSDTRTHVISDQFALTRDNNCEEMQGNSNTHDDIIILTSRSSKSSSGNDQENSMGRIDQNALDSSGRDEILDTIQTEQQFVTKHLTALTLISSSRRQLPVAKLGGEREQTVSRDKKQELTALTKAERNLSGRDEILDTIQTEQQFVTKRLTALTLISSYIHEDEHNDTRFLDNEDSIMNEEGNLEYVDLSCPEMSASHSAPKQHYPPNRDIVLEPIKTGEVPQITFRVYKVPPLLIKPEVYAKAAESKSKKQLGSDTKIVIPDEFSRAFSRDYRQIEKSQEFRHSEVQHLRMMLDHEVLGNDKSSLFEAADIYHQEFFTKTRELVTSSYSKCLRDASNISYIPVNDQPQQISMKLGLSNNTSFSRRPETQLHEQMISYIPVNDQPQQISMKLGLSNNTSGESPEESYEVTGSVVNRSETCSDTRTQEQFDPICESNSDGVQGNSNTHAETSSSGNDQESSLGRIDQNVKDSSRRDGVMDTIQTELQFVTKLLTALTLLTLLRPFSVVNSKVHWLEQAHASDILLKDSDVVVGLIKSSYLQEILLDISPIFDSLVRKSQPVTLQTFQGIMQRMGLPVNPQLYEPLENSYTTNDSEELSNVVIFAEDRRMFYYIPVLRGSLLQRKDAREREEPVNPWVLLKEHSNTTNVEDCHVPVQSLRPSYQTNEYINPSLPPKL